MTKAPDLAAAIAEFLVAEKAARDALTPDKLATYRARIAAGQIADMLPNVAAARQAQAVDVQAHAVLTLPQSTKDRALDLFSEYFRRNYPGPDTIIGKPDWHAPRIFAAALTAIKRAQEGRR